MKKIILLFICTVISFSVNAQLFYNASEVTITYSQWAPSKISYWDTWGEKVSYSVVPNPQGGAMIVINHKCNGKYIAISVTSKGINLLTDTQTVPIEEINSTWPTNYQYTNINYDFDHIYATKDGHRLFFIFGTNQWVEDTYNVLNFELENANSVKVVLAKSENDDNIYTLDGMIVDEPKEGIIYIQNGKKFVKE